MKTKVVQHVPRINISMSQTQSRSQLQTQTKIHRFPAFVMLTFLILFSKVFLPKIAFIPALLRAAQAHRHHGTSQRVIRFLVRILRNGDEVPECWLLLLLLLHQYADHVQVYERHDLVVVADLVVRVIAVADLTVLGVLAESTLS